jgi:hypothetical protein
MEKSIKCFGCEGLCEYTVGHPLPGLTHSEPACNTFTSWTDGDSEYISKCIAAVLEKEKNLSKWLLRHS